MPRPLRPSPRPSAAREGRSAYGRRRVPLSRRRGKGRGSLRHQPEGEGRSGKSWKGGSISELAAKGDSAPPPLLAVNNIEVIYNDVILVLRGVSLSVPQGTLVALLGANGAGKSTTLKAISGLLKTEDGEVTRGAVTFAGEVLDKLAPEAIVRRGIFQVMEGRRIVEDMTSIENLRLGAYTRRDSAVRRDIDMVFEYFPRLKERTGLAGYLSGGEQQMLAIGRALMARPKMMLLDEPSMGLSPLLVGEVFGIIRRLNRELGITMLLVNRTLGWR